MKKKSSHINKWLIPLSWVYGLVVFVRRKMFDCGILKRTEYGIPVICVGNLTAGGTGKTPHIEYLIRLLQDEYNVAVLSRGYKRKTTGFVLATATTSYKDVGDEPSQIKNKFPNITVAVDESRKHGIDTLLSMDPKPDIVLLDDAYQHLYVKPSFSILLTDYNRPFSTDKLLPAGRLREGAHRSDQANIIVVTKCPQRMKPIDIRIMSHDLNPFPYQTLVFTTIRYGNLVPLFQLNENGLKEERPLETIRNKKVLLLTGIASPKGILEKIGRYTKSVKMLSYSDHHNFKAKDIRTIESAYSSLSDNDAITIVTEKDAVRLIQRDDLSEQLKQSLYYLPIEVDFLDPNDKQIFNKKINNHVRKNSRNRKLHQ